MTRQERKIFVFESLDESIFQVYPHLRVAFSREVARVCGREHVLGTRYRTKRRWTLENRSTASKLVFDLFSHKLHAKLHEANQSEH